MAYNWLEMNNCELTSLPPHMHNSVLNWANFGTPHPDMMGSFFRSVLEGDLIQASISADDINARFLYEWGVFIHNFMPSGAHGSYEKLLAWHHGFAPAAA